MTIQEYVRDPAPSPSLSASVAHLLLTKSPRHAWLAHPRLNPHWEPESTAQQDFGTIAHALLLESDASRIVVVNEKDWRKDVAKAARDTARAEGKLPILRDDLAIVEAMVHAAKAKTRETPEIHAAFLDGTPEQTIIWREGDLHCRCRPDWQTNDHRLLIDYKTTTASAEPDAWSRGQMLSMGYDLQAAFGLRAVRSLYKPRDASFVFMVQETDPPYAVSFVGLHPEFEDFANRRMMTALEEWGHCLQTDTWPGYPSRVSWVMPPPWAVTQWDEKHAIEGL